MEAWEVTRRKEKRRTMTVRRFFIDLDQLQLTC
jgi:ribonucleotide reductase beta subunit family protein with ferritin-like domain